MKIILASASPRRRELLNSIGIDDFTVCPAKGEERAPEGLSPDELVKFLSLEKAREVARLYPNDLVIAADTIVWAGGKVLGKPQNERDAFNMLRLLSGKVHAVYTGVAVIKSGTVLSDAEHTLVTFRELTDDEINAYIATGEPMDKAGAYGIQGKAALLVSKIDGEYSTVVGLPLSKLGLMLNSIGVQLL